LQKALIEISQIIIHEVPIEDKKPLKCVPFFAFNQVGTLQDNNVAWVRRF
jgi:hypothetical protein